MLAISLLPRQATCSSSACISAIIYTCELCCKSKRICVVKGRGKGGERLVASSRSGERIAEKSGESDPGNRDACVRGGVRERQGYAAVRSGEVKHMKQSKKSQPSDYPVWQQEGDRRVPSRSDSNEPCGDGGVRVRLCCCVSRVLSYPLQRAARGGLYGCLAGCWLESIRSLEGCASSSWEGVMPVFRSFPVLYERGSLANCVRAGQLPVRVGYLDALPIEGKPPEKN